MWIVVGIAAVGIMLVLIPVIGSMLPKVHTVSRVAYLNKSQHDIWRLITDIQGQTIWRSDLRNVTRLPDRNGREVWIETDNRGQTRVLETMRFTPPRILVRQSVGLNEKFRYRWTYEVAEFGEVTSLAVTEESEIDSPGIRFVSRLLTGPSATIEGYLRLVAEKCGVDVNIINS